MDAAAADRLFGAHRRALVRPLVRPLPGASVLPARVTAGHHAWLITNGAPGSSVSSSD
ncbi:MULTISPECIES: hypothetical protein [Kitasatospora]|uniref:Uncharacterized protein n=1 Tax=Kitasatospora setae (strain ATCC 33774 / DSM 43861 / JCM 3304 / KCC A-0304 / NBRC 14216 / KM-6054) TaxID=452652 RepID=E4N5G7_KITSK|nr:MULTISPECIES: hypothetical protein [Kitasatospora]BAJ26448.1 hypothetical protein KSE_06060 [Kitasatospora setae KM-6054]